MPTLASIAFVVNLKFKGRTRWDSKGEPGQTDMRRLGKSLCRGVVDEVNSLRDVPLEALHTSLQKLLLVCVDIGQWIVRGLSSGWLESH